MNKHLKIILTKMCSYVGADISIIDKPQWFWEHTWTSDQKQDFEKWLTEYLKDRDAFRFISGSIINNKKARELTAKGFVWNYGWKDA